MLIGEGWLIRVRGLFGFMLVLKFVLDMGKNLGLKGEWGL